MFTRTAKAGAVLLMVAYLSLVSFGNVTDYGANLGFVAHVMTMDTTFRSEASMWRAVHSPALHHAAYVSIIVLQAAAALLCWIGGVCLLSRHPGAAPVSRRQGAGAGWPRPRDLNLVRPLPRHCELVVPDVAVLGMERQTHRLQPRLLTFLALVFVASRDNDADA